MRKIFFTLCTLFCTALIAISIFTMKNTDTDTINVPTQTAYIVKDYGGKVAVFTPDEQQPLAVYEVYVHLLPENDIELLRKGIPVDDDYTLLKTLENFGL
jgi:hypothetical protein